MGKRAMYITALAACLALAATFTGCGGSGGESSSSVFRYIPPSTSLPSSFIALASSGSVTLNWSAVSGVDSYRIYRMVSSPVTTSVSSLLVSGLSPTTTIYSDTTVSSGTTYYYVMTNVKGAVESTKSPEVSATPGSPAGTIQGTVLYEDREYGFGSFTGVTEWKPVRYAEVDIVNSGGDTVYSGVTDSMGKYSISVNSSPALAMVSVKSMATPSGSGTISTKSRAGTLYAVPSDYFPLSSPASVSLAISATNLAGGAFNILDVMTTGYDFVKAHEGVYPTVPLSTYWPDPQGTYFCDTCPIGIYVLSSAFDTDQYDDDVLWHEFGHFVAYIYSRDESQGGAHYLGDNTQDMRLSWSEGWGDFFPGALKTWLSTSGQNGMISSAPGVPLTAYVDTTAGGGFWVDFGSPSYNSYYSSNEVAVAKLLTDLNGTLSMLSIWNVIKAIRNSTERVNLELFWDMWLLVNGAADLSTLNTLYGNRSIVYAPDSYEGDDGLASAWTYTAGLPLHTLYATADEDFVLFTASSTSHTIATGDLRNGADTYLTLYDQSLATLATNDNAFATVPLPPNNATALSSRIQYSSFAIGQTYYVSVRSSSSRPASAGKYGSYALAISP